MNVEKYQEKRNESGSKTGAKKEGKQNRHKELIDHTFIMPAECLLCFYCYVFAWFK